MLNLNRRSNVVQNFSPYLKKKKTVFKSGNGYFNYFLKRLKKKEYKENREKFIFLVTIISVLFISGIIVSF